MIKAAFFDIDGTLIDASTGMIDPSERVRAALRRLKSEGNYIFIASGRPLRFLDRAILDFGFDGFVLMNGAVVVIDGKVIFDEPLERKLVDDMIDYSKAHALEYILESHPDVYLRAEFSIMDKFFRRIEIDVDRFVREFDERTVAVHKMEFVTEQYTDEIAAQYERWLHSEELTGITDPFHNNNLELYSRRNTKGSGILHALEYLGIPVEHSYAFGDGLNDIEMIRTVGVGFAMGNGNPKLKSIAKHVVPGVHEDGVAVGIEKYILGAGDR